MSGIDIAALGFVAMLGAIFLRVPVAVAMGLTGALGIWMIRGTPAPVMAQLKTLPFDTFANYNLSIVPLFILMGQFAVRSGMSMALFRAASDLMGHCRGGLAMATIGACGGFGAVCGSSLATASTMGQVALPEMRGRGYSDALSTGVLAAGGTLGILIPPSVILVIYAILTEQNIVKMFLAGFIPGILAAIGYLIVVMLYVRVVPGAAPQTERVTRRQALRSCAATWPVVVIFGLVMYGIAGDWDFSTPGADALFTPTEGAAVGAIATALYGIWTGTLRWGEFRAAVFETARVTALIFLIILGAAIFNSFLATTQAPAAIAGWVLAQGFVPVLVLIALLLVYLLLGCVMDSLSMIVLTVPIFFPIIEGLDFGLTVEQAAIWFGILTLVVVEVGLITPPVGLNLFIIRSVAPDVSLTDTYRGVLPFVTSDILRVGLLVAFPTISLWLVGVAF